MELNKLEKELQDYFGDKPVPAPFHHLHMDNAAKPKAKIVKVLNDLPPMINAYDFEEPFCTKQIETSLTKKEEEDSNLIRIDLNLAATELSKLEMGIEDFHVDNDEHLAVYDKYYDILFKSKK